ncbi:hypothetical protein Tco_0588472 [Tanacetum coccineum]
MDGLLGWDDDGPKWWKESHGRQSEMTKMRHHFGSRPLGYVDGERANVEQNAYRDETKGKSFSQDGS